MKSDRSKSNWNGNWEFYSESGKNINPNDLIFPLTSQETPGKPFRVIGTAFFVAKPAIFLTARHCLYQDDACTQPYNDLVGIFHHALNFRWCVVIESTDVAIGQLDTRSLSCDTCSGHKVLTPCTWSPCKGELICHWGCERSEISVIESTENEYRIMGQRKVGGYNGNFIETLNKYPPFTRSRCHITSATIPPGVSGGPVTLSTGQVVGISTSGSDGGGYSLVSLIQEAFDAKIPSHFRLDGESKGRKQSFGEMLEEFGVKILKGD